MEETDPTFDDPGEIASPPDESIRGSQLPCDLPTSKEPWIDLGDGVKEQVDPPRDSLGHKLGPGPSHSDAPPDAPLGDAPGEKDLSDKDSRNAPKIESEQETETTPLEGNVKGETFEPGPTPDVRPKSKMKTEKVVKPKAEPKVLPKSGVKKESAEGVANEPAPVKSKRERRRPGYLQDYAVGAANASIPRPQGGDLVVCEMGRLTSDGGWCCVSTRIV